MINSGEALNKVDHLKTATLTETINKILEVSESFYAKRTDGQIGNHLDALRTQLEGLLEDEPDQVAINRTYQNAVCVEEALRALRSIDYVYG